jgi:hypothetical protein
VVFGICVEVRAGVHKSSGPSFWFVGLQIIDFEITGIKHSGPVLVGRGVLDRFASPIERLACLASPNSKPKKKIAGQKSLGHASSGHVALWGNHHQTGTPTKPALLLVMTSY